MRKTIGVGILGVAAQLPAIVMEAFFTVDGWMKLGTWSVGIAIGLLTIQNIRQRTRRHAEAGRQQNELFKAQLEYWQRTGIPPSHLPPTRAAAAPARRVTALRQPSHPDHSMSINNAKLIGLNAALLAARVTAQKAFAAYSNANDLLTDAIADLATYITANADEPASSPIDVQPAKAEVIARADDQAALIAAIAAGATRIQSGAKQVDGNWTGLVLTTYVDLKGATLELLDGAPSWLAGVELAGTAGIGNGRIEANRRKAIVCSGKSVKIDNVSFGPDVSYCIHVQTGEAAITNPRTADTYWGYGVYIDVGAYAAIVGGFIGSSHDEASIRSAGGRCDLVDLTLNATLSKDPKAKRLAYRGDTPARSDGSAGLVAKGCTFHGLVGTNALDGYDAELMGIDRWYLANKHTLPAGAALFATLTQTARSAYLAGKSPAEIVRECFALSSIRATLSEADVAATLAERRRLISAVSTARFEDCTIVGQFRLAARATTRFVRGSIDAGTLPVFPGNCTPYCPAPNFVIDKNEPGKPPVLAFEGTSLKGAGLGVNASDYPGVTIDGKPLSL